MYVNNRSNQRQRYAKRTRSHGRWFVAICLVVAVAIGGGIAYTTHSGNANVATKVSAPVTTKTVAKSTTATANPTTTPKKSTAAASAACKSNTLPQLIVVSISQRHLWACETGTQVYDSAVVTGDENLPADLTPTGTYHVYGKEINLYLNGSDSTGSWHDHVSYWMPFLDNKYGAYGFHDATWRSDSDFGTIAPDSTNASHGCVECPLATAKWLYNWDHVGTTVSIES